MLIYGNIGTYQIAIHILSDVAIYFDSFGLEYIPKQITNFIANKIIKVEIDKTQAYNSIMFEILYRTYKFYFKQ